MQLMNKSLNFPVSAGNTENVKKICYRILIKMLKKRLVIKCIRIRYMRTCAFCKGAKNPLEKLLLYELIRKSLNIEQMAESN